MTIIDEKSYTNILDKSDLDNIYRKTENIILKPPASVLVGGFKKAGTSLNSTQEKL